MMTYSPHCLCLRLAWLCTMTALALIFVPLSLLLSLEGVIANTSGVVVWPVAFVPLWVFLSFCWFTPSVVQPFHLTGAIISISALWLSAGADHSPIVLVVPCQYRTILEHSRSPHPRPCWCFGAPSNALAIHDVRPRALADAGEQQCTPTLRTWLTQ